MKSRPNGVDASLDQLYTSCMEQLAQFRRTRNPEVSSSSCDEILRRTAAGDDEALNILLTISLPLIDSLCPADLRERSDDLRQLIAEKLIRKFRNPTAPYRVGDAGAFAGYRNYLRLTMISVAGNMRSRERQYESLDLIGDAPNLELFQRSGPTIREVEDRLRLERCLDLIPDALMRRAFYLRVMLREEVDQVVETLQLEGVQVTRRQVYNLVARCAELLSQIPEVREMFESDSGNLPE